jgi:hypothetical protein
VTPEPAEGETQEQGPETEDLVAADDAVIGKAFRWSLIVFLAVALVIGVVVFLETRKGPAETVKEAPTVLPEVQARDAEPPEVSFTDITLAAGITFVPENGATGKKLLPETMGPGCAFLDHDADGDPDILFLNGRPWPGSPRPAPGAPPTLALYENDGTGRFKDITAGSGLDVTLYGMGAAVGDYDNDGDADVYVTAVGENRLFQNAGGRFEDVTARAGVAGSASDWSTGAAFLDHDADGDLDLFVSNYVRWSPEIDETIDYRLVGVGRAYGPPTNFEGAQPLFFVNAGDGTFAERAKAAGLHVEDPATGVAVGKGLGVLPLDVDRDGRIDLMVANDTVRNFLFRNLGDGAFAEVAEEAGVAYDSNGAATGAMGIDAAYYRDDGALGIAIGNFATEMSSLYVSEPAGGGMVYFSDQAITEGIGPVSREMLSFGLFFFDYDLDGRLDLFQTNGHLEEEINKVQPSQHYRQPSQLFWNCGPGCRSTFVPVEGRTTGDLAQPIVGRAAAYADIDGDGDLDVLVTQAAERPILLRNDQRLGNRWLRLRLVGSPGKRVNRDAIGAWVEVEAGGRTQRQQVMPTRSYLAQAELVLTFGLGASERAGAVRVQWPGIKEPQEVGSLPAGRLHVIEER